MEASKRTRKLTQTAMLAGLYAAITFATFFMSFGAIQFRVSEALTILPVFTATAVPGLSLGCALANLVGFFAGVNPTGWLDAVFGTSATLLAALLTRRLGKDGPLWRKCLLAPLPPVLLNALIVGLELAFAFGPMNLPGFLSYALSVGIGQAVICYGLGVPLLLALSRKALYQKIFRE
ncbi:MAG: QueT transporter family protein [Oscillospiraceae bacterium]|jgi:uncharacterized membrane protein|nr:QueT transporter family protein [Oscillospiraceae bacterium]